MRLVAIIASAVASLATPALSCSLRNWNIYEDFAQPPGADVLGRAATVDWIVVEPPPPQRCPRYPDYFLNPAAFEDDAPDQDEGPEECRDDWFDQATAPLYVASTIERLKGRSPDRFVLATYVEPYWNDSAWIDGYWRKFSDHRRLPATSDISVSVEARSIAEGRHNDLAFWDSGDVGFTLDGSSSCGGQPTLDPAMRYIVFRDAMGAVLALEPVLYGDDEFLERLREHAADSTAFAVTPYPVADFFRSASALIQARVLKCEGDTGPRASSESEEATLRVTRGDNASVERLFWQAKRRPEATEFEFNDLWDFYQTRGETCPRGQAVLLLSAGLKGPPIWDGADAWTEAQFPGWNSAVGARLRETGEQDEITPLQFVVGDPLPTVGVARPIRIHDGRIRLADIPTGLTLTGPEWITVEQAFAWFEEGRAVP
jgi:hypothetical protein